MTVCSIAKRPHKSQSFLGLTKKESDSNAEKDADEPSTQNDATSAHTAAKIASAENSATKSSEADESEWRRSRSVVNFKRITYEKNNLFTFIDLLDAGFWTGKY